MVSVDLPKDSKKKWLFIKLFRDYDNIMVDSIASLSEEYALSYDLNIDEWRNFEEVVEQFDLKVKDNKSFLNENKYIVVNKDDVSTLIRFCEYRFVNEVSPCEMEVERIKYIILSNRKKELLEKLYEDLYSKAVQDKAFEVY